MKIKYFIYLLFFIHFAKCLDHYVDEIDSNIDKGYRYYGNYTYTQRAAYIGQDNSIIFDVVFPKREIKNFYLIFDYYVNAEDIDFNPSITLFDKTYTEKSDKIVVFIDTYDEFTVSMYISKYIYTRTIHINYVTGYSNYPFTLFSATGNFSAVYASNTNFAFYLDISKFEEDKTRYLYLSFNYTEKPLYKYFENSENIRNFNFKDYDGELNYFNNRVFEVKKPDNKYNYILLFFKGNKNYIPEGQYHIFNAFFGILENYEQYNIYPYIPFIVFLVIMIIIHIIFFNKFGKGAKSKEKIESKIDSDLKGSLL
jgi:hypothetical protein